MAAWTTVWHASVVVVVMGGVWLSRIGKQRQREGGEELVSVAPFNTPIMQPCPNTLPFLPLLLEGEEEVGCSPRPERRVLHQQPQPVPEQVDHQGSCILYLYFSVFGIISDVLCLCRCTTSAEASSTTSSTATINNQYELSLNEEASW